MNSDKLTELEIRKSKSGIKEKIYMMDKDFTRSFIKMEVITGGLDAEETFDKASTVSFITLGGILRLSNYD